MKFFLVLFFGVIVLVPFSKENDDDDARWGVGVDASYPRPHPQEIMVDAVNYIGLLLLHAHNEDNNNNIAFSPYGAASVLVALAEGVQGTALDEILHSTLLPLDVSATRIGFRDIHRHLKSYFIPQEGFLAGLTFNYENFTLKPDYESLLRFYGYDVDSFNNALYPDPYTTTTTFAPTDGRTTTTTARTTAGDATSSSSTRPSLVTIDLLPSTVGSDVDSTTKTDTTLNEVTYNDDGSFSVNLIPTTPSSTANDLLLETSEKQETNTLSVENFPTTVITSTISSLKTETVSSTSEDSATIRSTREDSETVRSTRVDSETVRSTREDSETVSSTSEESETTVSTTEESDNDNKSSSSENIETSTSSFKTTDETTIKSTPGGNLLKLSSKENDSLLAVETSFSDLEDVSSTTPLTASETLQTVDTSIVTEETETTSSLSTKSSINLRPLEEESNSTFDLDSTTTLDNLLEDENDNNTKIVRSARSIIDFLIARFYDKQYKQNMENSENQRTKRLAFSVNGRYRARNINFMTYETVLPFRYIPYLKSLALTFPLDSSQYYLLLVLPLDELGIDALINNIMTVNLKQIVYNLQPTLVKAIIPSFMLKGYVVLTSTLQKLGIQQIFEPRQADFSRMTDEPNIYVTNIEQAVTVTIRNYVDLYTTPQYNNRKYARTRPVEFKADHPFLYFVMDADIHVALMAGKITNPLNSRII